MKKIVMLIFFIVLAFNCTYAQHLPPEGEALEVAKDLINPANDNVFVSNPLPIGDHTFVSTERDDSHRCAYRLKNSTGCGYARGYGTPTCNDGGNSNWMPFYNCLDVFMKISGVTIAGTSIMKLSFNTATVTKFFSPSTAGGGYVHDFPAMGKYSMSSLNSYRSKLLLLSDLKVGDRITVNRDYITAAQQFVLDCSDQCSIMPNGNFISWNKEQVCQDRDYMKLTQYSTSTENIGITYSATGASSVTTANASADFFVTQEMINAIAANNGYLELSVYRPSANFMGDPIGSLRSTFRVKFVVDYAFESMQVSAIDYYDTRLTDFTAIEPTDYTWDIEDCNTAGFIINLHPDFKGCIQSTSSNVQAAIYDAFGEEKPSTLSITSTGVNVKLSSTGKFSPDDYIEVKVSFPNTKVTQTYYFRIDISTLQNNVSLVSLASKPLCEGHDSYYFSRSGANPDYDFAIQPPAEMYSSSEGIYKIPVSAKNIVFSTSFRRCALIIYSPIPAAIQLVKPQLTAQNFYCDDNTDFSGNNIQISNATLFNTPDFPQNYSPFTALIKEISGSNATTERNIPFFSNSTLIRASNSATEKIQLKVQAVANNGCTSVSDEVEFAKRISPQRPVVAGRLIYCGTDSNTYLVHNNPEYYTQYWLYDVTGGDERFLRHKGANFWIFRPDQHDPKEEAPTEVNGEAYYDMRLSAGSYEIRATHDLNSCVTVLPFTVANFNTNLFEMVAKGSMVKVCNSSMEGVDILNLFEDCEMKTILQSAQAATYNCAWTVKKEDKFLGAVSGAALRASVHNAEAGVYAVELTVTNADGCAKTFTSSLTVEARPAAFTIAADNSHVCNDAQVSISAGNASVADLTYAWKLNDQLTGETQSSISPGLLPGASYLTATVTNAAGCSSTSNRLEVNRYIFSPDVRFTSNEFSYCASDAAVNLLDLLEGSDKSRVLQKQDGISYTLTASASGLYFDETTVEPYDVDLSRSTAREYVLTLAMVQNGCEVRKEAKLTIKAVPASFAIASDKALSCDNDLVTITANGADGLSYRWYINGNQVPDQSSKSLETSLPDGTNIVYAVAVNNNGCSVSSAPVTVSAWEVKTNVSMAVAPLSECEVENGEIDLYT
ncbi:MAG: hypothetical protein LBK47_08420, partial [Prevotellaceae bacterium]|nr:hypothetical protein [Prevotellaceae bacterium]